MTDSKGEGQSPRKQAPVDYAKSAGGKTETSVSGADASASTVPPQTMGEVAPTVWPAAGRIAAIDYGTVRIGIAVTDPDRRIASPWLTYNRRSPSLDAAFFVQFTREERIVAYVVGLPVFASGDESPKSREARQFGRWLRLRVDRPVVFYDERYSSVLADQFMAQARLTQKQRQARRDQIAAQVLLQAFLEGGQHPTGDAGALGDP